MNEVRVMRRALGLTQAKLGQMVGLSGQTISAMEAGKRGRAWEARLLRTLRNYEPEPVVKGVTGEEIREKRLALGLTQTELGRMVGLSCTSVSMVERGRGMQQYVPMLWQALRDYEDGRVLMEAVARKGVCNEVGCRIRLYECVADVPKGWIPQWHVDFDGYCPPCAARRGCETAQVFLKEYEEGYESGG